jgi:hypothetical protein
VFIAVLNGRSPIREERVEALPAPYLRYTHDGVSLQALGKREIHFPALVPRSHLYHQGTVQVGPGPPAELLDAVDIEAQALARYAEEKPRILSASVTRFLVRAAASDLVMSWLQREAEKSGKPMDPVMRDFIRGLLDSLLAALDRADVRCWNFLPAEVLVALESVPAGIQPVCLEMHGEGNRILRETRTIAVESGRISLVQFFVTD